MSHTGSICDNVLDGTDMHLEQADTEWKFARTKLWMSYFEDGGTVPIPFNIIPTSKSLVYFFRWVFKKFFSRTKFAKNEAMKTVRRKARQASERDHRYQTVMRSLVRRYVTNEQRTAERQRGVTEDDCNEIKQDISALRFELIEMLGGRSGNGPGANLTMGKRGRKKERRLMKGFDFNLLFMDTATSFDDDAVDADGNRIDKSQNSKSPTRSKFARLARGLAGKRGSRGNKWKQLIEATRSKVIPFSRSSESVNSIGRGSGTRPSLATSDTEHNVTSPGFDANTKRCLFARKVTSLLQEESQSLENEVSDINEKTTTTTHRTNNGHNETKGENVEQQRPKKEKKPGNIVNTPQFVSLPVPTLQVSEDNSITNTNSTTQSHNITSNNANRSPSSGAGSRHVSPRRLSPSRSPVIRGSSVNSVIGLTHAHMADRVTNGFDHGTLNDEK